LNSHVPEGGRHGQYPAGLGIYTLCASRKPDHFSPQNVHLAVQRGLR
jgi:hypothetical protein